MVAGQRYQRPLTPNWAAMKTKKELTDLPVR